MLSLADSRMCDLYGQEFIISLNSNCAMSLAKYLLHVIQSIHFL